MVCTMTTTSANLPVKIGDLISVIYKKLLIDEIAPFLQMYPKQMLMYLVL